jgi:hypothetical protein
MLTKCKVKGEKFEEELHGIKMMVFPRIFLGLITLKLEDLTFKAH